MRRSRCRSGGGRSDRLRRPLNGPLRTAPRLPVDPEVLTHISPLGGPTSCPPANSHGQSADGGLSVRFCPLPESTRTWPAGPRASAWANRWPPPRPSDGASSPWPDASPARHVASPCISPTAGPGKTSSAPHWRNCAPCHSLPDRARGVSPVHYDNIRLADQCPGWAPGGLHLRSALKITANAAATGLNILLRVVATPHIVHFTGIRSSPARPLVPHPSSDHRRGIPSVDLG